MSALLDSILNREPLSRVLARESSEVDREFLRRWNESQRYDYTDEQIAAVLKQATEPLVKAAQLNPQEGAE